MAEVLGSWVMQSWVPEPELVPVPVPVPGLVQVPELVSELVPVPKLVLALAQLLSMPPPPVALPQTLDLHLSPITDLTHYTVQPTFERGVVVRLRVPHGIPADTDREDKRAHT